MSRPVSRLAYPTAALAPAAVPLEKQTYLTSAQAALYLGYTADKYPHPVRAFYELLRRVGPDRLQRFRPSGRRLLFLRRDLDALVQHARNGL